MSVESAAVFEGGTFQFDVAQEANSFVLHSKLVSRHSPVLHVLMHGQMKESRENRARLNHVDAGTFTRFAEFIYGGDYNALEACTVADDFEFERPCVGEHHSKAEAVHPFIPPEHSKTFYDEGPEANTGSEPSFDFTSKKKHNRGGKIPMPERLPPLDSSTVICPHTNNNLSFPKIENANTEADAVLMYDYTEALCHVRLYAFAEQYQIDVLKKLVLRKLQRALVDTPFHPLRVSQLLYLLELAYQNTPEFLSREEPLRELLTHYVAWNFEALAPIVEFQHFLEAGGVWVNDICQKVCRRL